ncbi:MAG: DUF1640 domain-containing protein [Gemmatimonadetes bacterium]|nr:DUF1640 domain-containing protein [Gemmatimonadota bacterium]
MDTHATVREFEAAGIETKQAEAIVKAMSWSRNDLVTKTDLAGFAKKEDLEELKSRLDSISAKMERFATKAYLEKFATKEDLERFATREDLQRFATNEDLEELKSRVDSLSAKMELFVTKEESKRFATKEDLVVIRAEMAAMKSDLEKQISSAVNKMMICMITMSALIVGMMKYL